VNTSGHKAMSLRGKAHLDPEETVQLPVVCSGLSHTNGNLEQRGQQVEGGSPFPLLCPGEAPSGVPCPVLGSPV